MVAKNTISILEKIKEKINKFDQPRNNVDQKNFADLHDEFEYIDNAKNDNQKNPQIEEVVVENENIIPEDDAIFEHEIENSFDKNNQQNQDLEQNFESENRLNVEEHHDELLSFPEDEELSFEENKEEKHFEESVQNPLESRQETASAENQNLEEFHEEELDEEKIAQEDVTQENNLTQPQIQQQNIEDFDQEESENDEEDFSNLDEEKIEGEEDFVHEIEEIEEDGGKNFAPLQQNKSDTKVIQNFNPEEIYNYKEKSKLKPDVSDENYDEVYGNSHENLEEISEQNQAIQQQSQEIKNHLQNSILNEKVLSQTSESLKKLVEAKGAVAQVDTFARSEIFAEIAAKLMQPKLEKWLNENLPNLVEKIVRDEIKKIVK